MWLWVLAQVLQQVRFPTMTQAELCQVADHPMVAGDPLIQVRAPSLVRLMQRLAGQAGGYRHKEQECFLHLFDVMRAIQPPICASCCRPSARVYHTGTTMMS